MIVVQHFLRAVIPGPGLKQTEVIQASNSPAPMTIAIAGLAGSVNATFGSELDQNDIINISSSFGQEGAPLRLTRLMLLVSTTYGPPLEQPALL